MKMLFSLITILFCLNTYSSGVDYWLERGNFADENMTSNDGQLLIVENDIALPFSGDRGTISLDSELWPNGVIVWDIDRAFRNDRELINGVLEAIQQISSRTVLKFKKRTNEANYINIYRDNGCFSEIGYKGRVQRLSLGQGCNMWHTTAHELLHAAGILHEHTRADRDRYININFANLGPLGKSNFTVVRHKTNGPFDYDSIMLYRSFTYVPFVINPNIPMWIRKDNGQPQFEDNQDLSPLDIQTINNLYSSEINPKPDTDTDTDTDISDKIDTKDCQKIEYLNSRNFDSSLLNTITSMNQFKSNKCISVTFSEEYNVNLLPERINDWLVEIKNTGGEVKQVAISRSWFKQLFDWLIKIITGRDSSKLKAQASLINATIFYDKQTEYVLEVKFSPRT